MNLIRYKEDTIKVSRFFGSALIRERVVEL